MIDSDDADRAGVILAILVVFVAMLAVFYISIGLFASDNRGLDWAFPVLYLGLGGLFLSVVVLLSRLACKMD